MASIDDVFANEALAALAFLPSVNMQGSSCGILSTLENAVRRPKAIGTPSTTENQAFSIMISKCDVVQRFFVHYCLLKAG